MTDRKDPTDRPRRAGDTGQLPVVERDRIEKSRVRFVLALGRALHRYGTPAHRLEEALAQVCRRLGLRAQIMSTPTSLTIGFGDPAEQRTAMMRVDTGAVDLGKMARLDALADAVLEREIDSEDALHQIEAIEAAPPAWGRLPETATYGLTAASIAVFFGGGWRDVAAAATVGLALGLLMLVLRRRAHSARAVELIGAFAAAFGANAAARLVAGVTPSIVTIAALIALLPGLTLTVAMTELATRNLVSGTARLMSAVIVLLELALGVALGERLARALWHVAVVTPTPLPGWAEWVAFVAGTVGMVVVCQAEPRALGWILLTSLIAFAASNFGADLLGPELGVLIGALALGIAANLYARLLGRPQQVVLVPAVILMVPGSMGFRGISSLLDRNTMTGIETTFATFVVAMAIVAGLLIANALVSPRRAL
ncbi:MAG: threonine/serine exporter family protein [Myxococcales bacterium]|nr:threonine/serine exporter family protein [Myxococcales bacterium]